MKISLFLAALSLLGVIDRSIAANAALVKRPNPALVPAPTTKSKILSIRGGGVVEPKTAVKVSGAVYAANGIWCTLAPNCLAKAYGWKIGPLNAINYSVLQRNGAAILSVGLVAYCLFFRKDCDVNLALGIGALPLACKFLASILENDEGSIGPNKAKEAVALLVHSLAAYGGLTGAEWAPTAFKALAIFCLLIGLHMPIGVKSAVKFWEVKETDEYTDGIIKTLGSNYAVLGALYAGLAWGDKDPFKAYGYASLLAFVLHSYVFLLSPEFKVLEMDTIKFVFPWITMAAVVAASTLLD